MIGLFYWPSNSILLFHCLLTLQTALQTETELTIFGTIKQLMALDTQRLRLILTLYHIPLICFHRSAWLLPEFPQVVDRCWLWLDLTTWRFL